MSDTTTKGQGRGFAGMDPEKRRQIASAGGNAAHAKGTAHEFDSTEAKYAGRKGGAVSSARRRAAAKISIQTTGYVGDRQSLGTQLLERGR